MNGSTVGNAKLKQEEGVVDIVTSGNESNVPVVNVLSVVDVPEDAPNVVSNESPNIVNPDVVVSGDGNNPPKIPVGNEIISKEEVVWFYCGGMPCEWPEISQVIVWQVEMMYYTEPDGTQTDNFGHPIENSKL